MSTKDAREGLVAVVDYILNSAGEREIEVIGAAAERRKRELSQSSQMPVIDPENAAKQMAESINSSIAASLDGVRKTFRSFAADMLQKEAPELSAEQAAILVDSWIPANGSYDGKLRPVAENKKISGLPSDVLYKMIIQFVSYGIGEMSQKENKELKDTVGNWTEKYWEHFPPQIRTEIKSFINGEITSGEFQKNIKELIS